MSNKFGRKLCYILRHKPSEYNITLDEYGYADINELVESINKKDKSKINREFIENEVLADEKDRYLILDDKIRCNFGHSVPVKHPRQEQKVPKFLYHGTKKANLDSIKKNGIKSMGRDVHLTDDISVAKQVGLRHAKKEEELLIITVETSGLPITCTGTSTYLIDFVPANNLWEWKESVYN